MKNLLLKLSYLLPAAMLTLAACSEDNVDEPATQEYCVTEFESTDMPATIPAEGGDYTLTFKLTTVTRTVQSETVFEPWSY
ncbi:MAG: hypothetical protein K2O07_02185, partial [Alistipes sp.]|nr:hypothetical protein [Alistipes sp.]